MKKFLAVVPTDSGPVPNLDSGARSNQQNALPTIGIDTGISNISNLNISVILSFFIKFFFIIAALAALLYLLLGAFSWITSGGNKESVEKAREKIQAAVIGIVLIIGVVAIAVTLEKFVFNGAICFGLSCEIKIPGLISPR